MFKVGDVVECKRDGIVGHVIETTEKSVRVFDPRTEHVIVVNSYSHKEVAMIRKRTKAFANCLSLLNGLDSKVCARKIIDIARSESLITELEALLLIELNNCHETCDDSVV